jgi:hypothetical protein
LLAALQEDDIELGLIPNGVIPLVDPYFASHGINSDRRDDILVWRYKKEKPEELRPYTESLLGFAAHFVPIVQEGAARAGLITHHNGKPKPSLWARLWPWIAR